MRPSGNVLPAYWCVWLHVVWLCCGKESNGKMSKASVLVLEMERIISKYSSVNINIFFYHLQTILFMGTKPARRCENRHKKQREFLCKWYSLNLNFGKQSLSLSKKISVIRAKRRFWRPKKRAKLPELGSGRGVRWFGQCPKGNVFFYWCLLLEMLAILAK